MAINLGDTIYGRILAARQREADIARQELQQQKMQRMQSDATLMQQQQKAFQDMDRERLASELRQREAAQAATLAGEEIPQFSATAGGAEQARLGELQGLAMQRQAEAAARQKQELQAGQIAGRQALEGVRQGAMTQRAGMRGEERKAQLLQAQQQFDAEMQQAVSENEKDRALQRYLAYLKLLGRDSQARAQRGSGGITYMKERRLRADQEIKRVMRSLREADPSQLGQMLKDLDPTAAQSFRSREQALRDIERKLVAKAQTYIELGDDENFFQAVDEAYRGDVPAFGLGGVTPENLGTAQDFLEQVRAAEGR